MLAACCLLSFLIEPIAQRCLLSLWRLQRDVPGLTRAAIPILHNEGVRALTVGVNGGSAPPAVPKYQPFWWKDQASGAALLAFWHPGALLGIQREQRRGFTETISCRGPAPG